ncbi:MAG: DoxX family protein [Actinomycetota bacterium]
MPPYVPRHREVVLASGVAELAGAAAMIPAQARQLARWWLIGVLVAVFPANVHMAISPEQVKGLDLDRIPRWALWARLPLQPLMVLWVWRATAEKG